MVAAARLEASLGVRGRYEAYASNAHKRPCPVGVQEELYDIVRAWLTVGSPASSCYGVDGRACVKALDLLSRTAGRTKLTEFIESCRSCDGACDACKATSSSIGRPNRSCMQRMTARFFGLQRDQMVMLCPVCARPVWSRVDGELHGSFHLAKSRGVLFVTHSECEEALHSAMYAALTVWRESRPTRRGATDFQDAFVALLSATCDDENAAQVYLDAFVTDIVQQATSLKSLPRQVSTRKNETEALVASVAEFVARDTTREMRFAAHFVRKSALNGLQDGLQNEWNANEIGYLAGKVNSLTDPFIRGLGDVVVLAETYISTMSRRMTTIDAHEENADAPTWSTLVDDTNAILSTMLNATMTIVTGALADIGGGFASIFHAIERFEYPQRTFFCFKSSRAMAVGGASRPIVCGVAEMRAVLVTRPDIDDIDVATDAANTPEYGARYAIRCLVDASRERTEVKRGTYAALPSSPGFASPPRSKGAGSSDALAGGPGEVLMGGIDPVSAIKAAPAVNAVFLASRDAFLSPDFAWTRENKTSLFAGETLTKVRRFHETIYAEHATDRQTQRNDVADARLRRDFERSPSMSAPIPEIELATLASLAVDGRKRRRTLEFILTFVSDEELGDLGLRRS